MASSPAFKRNDASLAALARGPEERRNKAPFGLLQLSDPQPAVDNRSELNELQSRSLAAGCLHQSGSRLAQSKKWQVRRPKAA